MAIVSHWFPNKSSLWFIPFNFLPDPKTIRLMALLTTHIFKHTHIYIGGPLPLNQWLGGMYPNEKCSN